MVGLLCSSSASAQQVQELFFGAAPLGRAPANCVSPDGSFLPGPNTRLIDSNFMIWTLNGGIVFMSPFGGQLVNAAYTQGVIRLEYKGGKIYQENYALGWWYWNGISWTGTTDPGP
jgi:hypothetical protein